MNMESLENLFAEMREKYPELPEDTIRAHVKLYPRNRPGLLNELNRISATLGAIGGSSSTFYVDDPANNPGMGRLSMPEPPPALIVTPPQSPEKEKRSQVPTLALAENLNYEAFLLQNQQERLRALDEQAARDSQTLLELRREVERKQRMIYESSLEPSQQYPDMTIDKLLELTQANRQLCVKIHCLVTEIDLQTDGRAPLGFYDNIYPGPDNPSLAQQPVSRRDRATEPEEPMWACEHCTYDNHIEMKSCEMCFNPRSSSAPYQ